MRARERGGRREREREREREVANYTDVVVHLM